MKNFIENYATVSVSLCGKIHEVNSNIVKVRLTQLATLRLLAKKIVCNGCLRSEQFGFVVSDHNGNEVAVARNDEKGNIAFPEITFERAGEYVYTIKEAAEKHKGWIMDKRVYKIVVTVTPGIKGKMTASIEYPDGLPVFVNICCCTCPCCMGECLKSKK